LAKVLVKGGEGDQMVIMGPVKFINQRKDLQRRPVARKCRLVREPFLGAQRRKRGKETVKKGQKESTEIIKRGGSEARAKCMQQKSGTGWGEGGKQRWGKGEGRSISEKIVEERNA